MTPERKRSLIKVAGLGAFGVVVFFVSLVIAFPYDRIKDQLVAVASTQNLDVEVGSAGPVFGMGVALDEVLVRTRPEPGQKASVLQIDKARVRVSPLAQLQGVLDYSVNLHTLEGVIEADVRAEKALGVTKVSTREISMAQLPGVKQAINLPLGGLLDLDLDLASPNHRNGEANGSLAWKWADMSLGDGKEKLKIAGNPLLAEGISLPQVKLGDFAGKVVFTKGVGRLQGVGARSPDGEVRIEGEVRLADPLVFTNVDVYVMFKFSDAMLKKADKLQLMLQFAESMGKRSDGFYGFRLSGTAGRMGPVQWMKTSPFPGGANPRAALDPRAPGQGISPAAAARALAVDRVPAIAPPRPAATLPAQAVPSAPPQPAPASPGLGATASAAATDLPANANLPRYVTSPPRE